MNKILKSHKITLKNNVSFNFNDEKSVFHAAQSAGILLDHSCLVGRCSSCKVRVLSGNTVNIEDEFVLNDEEKKLNYVLSCNVKPVSDVKLDIEGLNGITLYEKKIIPSKINRIEKLTDDVIKLVLRLPPNANFKFNAGQYVNIIRGNITRSYSIANSPNHKNELEFLIKKYQNGLMSNYLFENSKINDLLRLEGPIGTFFLRESNAKNLVFIATGTGVAPIKSMLDNLENSYEGLKDKKLWVIIGARFKKDLFWEPNINKLNIKYIPVLSQEKNEWNGETGYVQNIILKNKIDLDSTQVYACGSNNMIKSARKLLLTSGLKEHSFFSDAFIQTN